MASPHILLLLSSCLFFLVNSLPTSTSEPDSLPMFNISKSVFPLPRYDHSGKIQSRTPFYPTDSCWISVYRDLYNSIDCTPECHGGYFTVEEVVVENHYNVKERYATFPGINMNGEWRYHVLDGHRGFQVSSKWDALRDLYGFREAYIHIDGHKDMIHSSNCWFEGGSELFGQKGRAHCFLWCEELKL